jgi:DNA mismatch endonuclease (patch repair protein)
LARGDVFSREQRSALMSRIRGKDTSPEVRLRKALFALGLRYRVHSKHLPGKPDIVFPRYRAAVFVNGCFWHGHTCRLFRWPASNRAFWRTKIVGNRRRDASVRNRLADAGWRTITVWECSVRKAPQEKFAEVAAEIRRWLLAV